MPFRTLRALLPALLAAATWTGSAAAQNSVAIYVQAGSGGLAATGAGDSAGDLRRALQSKHSLQVVNSPSEADVIVRLDSRNERKEAGDTHTTANSSNDGKRTDITTSQSTKTIKEIHATLISGDFQMPMEAEDSLSWRFAAGNLASNIERWTRENYSKLIEHRYAHSAAPAGPLAPTAQYAPSIGGADAAPNPPQAEPQGATQGGNASASITPGMTEQQVLAALGTPQKRVSFGQKTMWNYRGMQVVFDSGRVSDVKF